MAGTGQTPGEEGAALAAAFSELLDRIDSTDDADERTDAIRDVGPLLTELYNRMLEMRKQEIVRLRDEKKLTLRALAVRVGTSPAAAGFAVSGRKKKGSGK